MVHHVRKCRTYLFTSAVYFQLGALSVYSPSSKSSNLRIHIHKANSLTERSDAGPGATRSILSTRVAQRRLPFLGALPPKRVGDTSS